MMSTYNSIGLFVNCGRVNVWIVEMMMMMMMIIIIIIIKGIYIAQVSKGHKVSK